MRLRSLLFVPGDRPDRMEKALGAGADALILDLEDAVAPAARPEARKAVAAFLDANPSERLWVRINPLDGAE
ncbi:MAG TPA: aldolase/citrate lyase family protein, partial [Amaricoccus sp.]|nr:aldolase/citrate lyase family protein [Amaricoccus sp.]